MTKDMKIVVDFCYENICDFEERVKMALDKIYYWRYPLTLVDMSLYGDIADAIAECAEEYDIDAESIDIEEVIRA